MHHLLAPLLMALVALGAHRAMGEGMILARWYDWWAARGWWISKPMATCPRCMVSAWGIPALWLTFGLDPLTVVPYLLAAVGIQDLIER